MSNEADKFFQTKFTEYTDQYLTGMSKPGVKPDLIITQFARTSQDAGDICNWPQSEALRYIAEANAGKKAKTALETLTLQTAVAFLADAGVFAADVRQIKTPENYARMIKNIGEKHWGYISHDSIQESIPGMHLTYDGRLPIDAVVKPAHKKGTVPLKNQNVFKAKTYIEASEPTPEQVWRNFSGFLAKDSLPCPEITGRAMESIGWYMQQELPIELVLVLSLEKFKSPLKEITHLPDLAEAGMLLRFKQLDEAVSCRHKPGIKITIINESPAFTGFAGNREKKSQEIGEYKAAFLKMAKKLGMAEKMQVYDMNRIFEGQPGGRFEEESARFNPDQEQINLFTRVEFTNAEISGLLDAGEIQNLTVADLLTIYSAEFSVAGFQIPGTEQTGFQKQIAEKIRRKAVAQAIEFRIYSTARSVVQDQYLRNQGIVTGPYIKINGVDKNGGQVFFPLTNEGIMPQHGVGVLTSDGKIKTVPVIKIFLDPDRYKRVYDEELDINYFKEI